MNALLDFKKIEKISKALGDPYRLKIIEAIRKDCSWTECSDIVDMLNLSQSTTSHHIKLLVEAGADLTAKDKVYEGTPFDWAEYIQREVGLNEQAKNNYLLIADYLQKQTAGKE